MTYLGMLHSGQSAQLQEVLGNANIKARLTGLGLVPGATVKVIQNRKGQGLMITLGNNKIAVGHTLSHKIIVTPNL